MNKNTEKPENKKYIFKNLQIGNTDLIGCRCNGYDLHKYLRKKNIDSSQLVWIKMSNDANTYLISGNQIDRDITNNHCSEISKNYNLQNLYGPSAYDILYNKLFLETDVVHYHLIHGLEFNIQLLPILTSIKPTVWSIHDPWAISGHCIHPYNCEKWKKGCGDCPSLDNNFAMRKDNTALNFEIKKNAILNSKLDIIVVSRWLEKLVKASPIFKNSNIHYIPYGINLNIFKPLNKITIRRELGIPQDALVFVARCQYSEYKGFDYIEYMLDKLKTKKDIYLLLLDGKIRNPKKNYKYIEYGWVNDEQLLTKIYNSADLFLMPSTAESFGLMAIEAMSCAILPIVLKGSALDDVVNAPYSGVAVKRDKKEYAKVVQYFVDHESERLKRGDRCLKYSARNYDKDLHVKKIIEVYYQAIKRHKLDNSTKYLLEQLKKNMSTEPVLQLTKNNNISINNESVIKKAMRKLFFYWPPYRKLLYVEQNLSKKIDYLQQKINRI